eukprot:jgi/Chlat1/58/ChrspC240389S00933
MACCHAALLLTPSAGVCAAARRRHGYMLQPPTWPGCGGLQLSGVGWARSFSSAARFSHHCNRIGRRFRPSQRQARCQSDATAGGLGDTGPLEERTTMPDLLETPDGGRPTWVRTMVLLGGAAAFAAFAFFGARASHRSDVQNCPTPVATQRYYEYVVKDGDTMGSIADTFHVPLEKLAAVNKGAYDMIYTGQKLTIPQEQASNGYHHESGTLSTNALQTLKDLQKDPDLSFFSRAFRLASQPRKHSAFEIAEYRLKLAFEHSPASKLMFLFVVVSILWAIGTVVYYRVHPEHKWTLSLYKSWSYISGATGSSLDDEEGPTQFVASILFLTGGIILTGVILTGGITLTGGIILTGVIFFALLQGLTTETLSSQMDMLRSGHSSVVESNHTVVLGWNETTVPLIRELCVASKGSASAKKSIVVLADRNIDDMKREVATMVPPEDIRAARIVYREGDPASLNAQLWVAADTARAIVVLAEPGDPELVDTKALRVVLATKGTVQHALHGQKILGAPKTHKDRQMLLHAPHKGSHEPAIAPDVRLPLVVQTKTAKGRRLVQLAAGNQASDPRHVTMVDTDSLIGHNLVLCATQRPGLAQVLRKLLGFSHEEFYISAWPQLAGRTFTDAMGSFPNASPVGIMDFRSQRIVVPKADYIMKATDQLVAVARTQEDYFPAARPFRPIVTSLPARQVTALAVPKQFLICNWHSAMAEMVTDLNEWAAIGSEVVIFANNADQNAQSELQRLASKGTFPHIKLSFVTGSTTSFEDIASIKPARFDSIIIASPRLREGDIVDIDGSDSSVLATILLIEDNVKHCTQHPQITVEVNDPLTVNLVKTASAETQCVVSTQMAANYIAQACVDKQVIVLWRDLLDADGKEIYLKPINRYVNPGEHISFWELQQRALMRGEAALGYRVTSKDAVVLNPQNKEQLLEFGADDAAVVIAEDDLM